MWGKTGEDFSRKPFGAGVLAGRDLGGERRVSVFPVDTSERQYLMI